TAPGKGILELEHSAGKLERPIELVSRSFPSEDILLDRTNTALRTVPDPAKTAESLAFAKIFQSSDPTAILALGRLVPPVPEPWRKTSGFGDTRKYIYYNGSSEYSVHGGIDIGATEGTTVSACASGRVVFAAPRIVTGKTIVIEHLPGLFSIYMHLSSIATDEGKIVEAGQTIGKVGSTGLSTGPHLHWELRIGQVSVDPEYWLTRPLLDKETDSGRIKLPIEGR
ncbi:MAG TPA: M23 family metallopeptidase, partial [Rectinemataceae bacterium]